MKFDKAHKDILIEVPRIKGAHVEILQNGEKITPKQGMAMGDSIQTNIAGQLTPCLQQAADKTRYLVEVHFSAVRNRGHCCYSPETGKKLLQKAMVLTLTAAMLVGTPLTASARGLSDVFMIENNEGEQIGNFDNSATGTVTNSATNTKSTVLGELANEVAGIVLNESSVEMEMEGEYNPQDAVGFKLKADFVNANGEIINADKLNDAKKRFKWKIEGGEGTAVASLFNLGKKTETRKINGKDVTSDGSGRTDELYLIARAGGRTKVTVSIDDYENNAHYAVTADVYVKRFATKLWLEGVGDEAYEGESLDLDQFLKVEPEDASDKVTYAITDANSLKYASIKGNVVTFKKNAGDQTIKIQPLGERKEGLECTFTVNKSVHATKITFKQGESDCTKGYEWITNEKGDLDDHPVEFEAVLEGKQNAKSTDKVTWIAQNSDIVAVQKVVSDIRAKDGKDGEHKVNLIVKKAGKGKIVAQTSGGKKATLTVTVNAYLTAIKLEVDEEKPLELYAGQVFDLNDVATQYFDKVGSENFTDAGLTWTFVKDYKGAKDKDMKRVASVSKTGELTIKPDLAKAPTIKNEDGTETKVIALQVSNAKNIAKNGSEYFAKKGTIFGGKDNNKVTSATNAETLVINLTQINVTRINVYKALRFSDGVTPLVSATSTADGKAPKDPEKIAVEGSKAYGVTAMAIIEGYNEGKETSTLKDGKTPVATILGWNSKNTKSATVKMNKTSGAATIFGIKKGNSNVTVSSATIKKAATTTKPATYKNIKATFKVNVIQPTKSIKLSIKNTGLACKDNTKDLKATIKPVFDKGTTTKAKDVQWSASITKKGETVSTPLGNDAIKNGKLTLKKNDYNFGDKIKVTARVADAGVTATIELTVVKKTTSVAVGGFDNIKNPDDKVTVSNKPIDLKRYEVYTIKTTIDNGEIPDYMDVTYTVDKPGYVLIVKNAKSDTATILPLVVTAKPIKITPVTADGKKGKAITVNIIPEDSQTPGGSDGTK